MWDQEQLRRPRSVSYNGVLAQKDHVTPGPLLVERLKHTPAVIGRRLFQIEHAFPRRI